MSKQILTNKTDRLTEIKDEIKELIEEARNLCSDTDEKNRCEGYWYAHIIRALDNDHYYVGGSFITLQDSIDSISEDLLTVEEEESD